MTKKITLFIAALSLIIVGACQKKEEPPKPQVQSPMAQPSDLSQPMKSPETMPPHGNMPSGVKKEEKKVIVPEDIKKSWSKVKLSFTDKTANKSKEYTIAIGSSSEISGTPLKISVLEFLPDFKMSGSTITSGSNETINPAAHVEILENGKTIFKGWLYSKFPDIHPFEHDKYAVKLKEGVRK